MPGFVDFAELKQRVSISSAIEFLQLSPVEKQTDKGPQLRCACPQCGGDKRILTITPAIEKFYCFGSRDHGDVIALVAHVLDCTAKEAAFKLDAWAGGTKPAKTSTVNSTVRTVPEEKAPERRLQPLDYLQADHEKVIGLGVAPETCKSFGAGYAPRGIMRGRLAIPIHTRMGELVAYCGRAVSGESPTLTFPNGFRPEQYVFNAHHMMEGELYLTLDPLHVLTAFENGVENVVSFLTESISAEQLQVLAALMDEKGCTTVELV